MSENETSVMILGMFLDRCLFPHNIQGPPDKSLGAVEVKFGFLKSKRNWWEKNIYRDKKTINDTFFGKIHWDDCNSTLNLFSTSKGPRTKVWGPWRSNSGFSNRRGIGAKKTFTGIKKP